MDYSYIFKNNKLNKERLLNYGFNVNNDIFTYKKDLNDSELYLLLTIQNNTLKARVYDKQLDEEYLPFMIKNTAGGFSSKIHEDVDQIVDDIVKQCFYNDSMKDKVLHYVKEKYNTLPEYPWDNHPSYGTLKTNKNKKWYGLIMTFPFKTLGVDKNEIVTAINLKNDPEKIQELLDNKTYFPAYHMNKKYWLTILLDNSISEETIYSLIDESYALVDKK